jgi:hypothetical protein
LIFLISNYLSATPSVIAPTPSPEPKKNLPDKVVPASVPSASPIKKVEKPQTQYGMKIGKLSSFYNSNAYGRVINIQLLNTMSVREGDVVIINGSQYKITYVISFHYYIITYILRYIKCVFFIISLIYL